MKRGIWILWLFLFSFSISYSEVRLVDVGIEDFIRFVSIKTGKNILYSRTDIPKTVKINMYAVSELTNDDIIKVFDAVLKSNNLALIRKGEVFLVIRSSKVRQLGSDIGVPNSDRALVTSVFKLENISVSEASRAIKHLLSPFGRYDVIKAVNAVVITDVRDRLKDIEKFLKSLDRSSNVVFKVFHISEVDSSNVAAELSKFFRELSRRKPGISVPVVVSEAVTNSIIVAARRDEIPYIKEVIDVIIQRAKQSKAQKIFYLKNAVAKDVHKVLSGLIAKDKFLKGVSLSYDEPTNSIIVMGKPAALARIEDLINRLDIPRKQIFIEALFVETTLSKLAEFGVEWSGITKVSGGVGYVGSATSGTMAQIESGILGKGEFTPLPGGFVLGVLGDTVTYNGIKFPTISALFSALKSESGINILSNPRIVTLDNQKATIFVGENRPYLISEKYDINGNPIYSYTYKDVGVKLNIWPHISGDKILLKVTLEVNKVSEEIARGRTVAPVTLTRKTETEIALKDGEKILISGLIESDSGKVKKGVPLLSNIPIVGNLFKYESKSASKTNLAIFLSVKLINSPSEVKGKLIGNKSVKEKL